MSAEQDLCRWMPKTKVFRRVLIKSTGVILARHG
jgi:hypothetical protein